MDDGGKHSNNESCRQDREGEKEDGYEKKGLEDRTNPLLKHDNATSRRGEIQADQPLAPIPQ